MVPHAADDQRTAKEILEHSGEDSVTSATESDALSGLWGLSSSYIALSDHTCSRHLAPSFQTHLLMRLEYS